MIKTIKEHKEDPSSHTTTNRGTKRDEKYQHKPRRQNDNKSDTQSRDKPKQITDSQGKREHDYSKEAHEARGVCFGFKNKKCKRGDKCLSTHADSAELHMGEMIMKPPILT